MHHHIHDDILLGPIIGCILVTLGWNFNIVSSPKKSLYVYQTSNSESQMGKKLVNHTSKYLGFENHGCR
jgi:hypothetical protein